MKKIIATVLAMVMALALCTTAFAAGETTITAKAYRMTANGALMEGDKVATFHPAVAATVNDDGEQTNTANIAYYSFEGLNCVVASSLADADVVLYSDAAGKNVMMYLAIAPVAYDGTGTVFTNFGKKCGQVTYTNDSTKTYYTTNDEGDKGIYVADEDGTKALMVNGKLITVAENAVASTANAVKHAAVPTVADGKVTGYTCATCKAVAVKAANVMSIPTDASRIDDTLYYFPASATPVTPDNGKDSPKTFDAGIAMYVGMALTSVAGSAVVIGKKKEF